MIGMLQLVPSAPAILTVMIAVRCQKSVANLHGESSYTAHGNDCNSHIVKSTSRPNIPGPRLRRTDDSTTPRDVDRMVVRHFAT